MCVPKNKNENLRVCMLDCDKLRGSFFSCQQSMNLEGILDLSEIVLESETLETSSELDEFTDIDRMHDEAFFLENMDEILSFIVNNHVLSDNGAVKSKLLGVFVGQVDDLAAKFCDLFLGFL